MKTVLLMVILFFLLIFPHELGHFIAAKLCGVQVNEFAFGMGPALFQKQGKETLYSFRAIPVGGYCAMEGEDKEASTENTRAFNNRRWWQKVIILISGALMNILIAIIALSIVIGVTGVATTVVDDVMKDSPAAIAGIEPGDKIEKVDGKKINEFSDVVKSVDKKEITVTVTRNGNEENFTLKPKYNKEQKRSLIGIQPRVKRSFKTSIQYGTKGTGKIIAMIFKALGNMISTGNFADNVSGPVGMVSIVKDTASGGLLYFLYLLAVISANLAVFNLLPFPALDGGRIIFVFIRLVTGEAISDETEGKVHAVGMMLLLFFMIFATWNDITRLIK